MEEKVFIGTYTHSGSEGIYQAVFEDGHLRIKGSQAALNPSYVAVYGDRLYAVEESRNGSAMAYKMNGLALSPTGKQHTLGDAPCHVLSDGRWLYVSNYTSGSLSVFSLDHGDIAGPPNLITHEGSSVHVTRQRSAHVHQTAFSPDGKYIAVCDLGIDKVLFYPHDRQGIRTPGEAVLAPEGAGPRHVIFGRDTVWYAVCELSCEILVYHGYGKTAMLTQRIPTLREGETGACAALKLSPDGLWLMASVRDANTLVLLRILSDGCLSEPRHYCTQGDCPRDAAFSPDGQHVLCALEKSDAVTVFKASAGVLSFVESVHVPTPSCICFAQ